MFFTVYKGYALTAQQVGERVTVKPPHKIEEEVTFADFGEARQYVDKQLTQLSIKLPFEGFYESSHDALFDAWLSCEQEELSTEQSEQLADLFYNSINWKLARQKYAAKYTEYFAVYLSGLIGVEIQLSFHELVSPKYYNFETGSIFALISLADMQLIINSTNDKDIREAVREQFTSHEGFVSYHSNDYDEWEKDLTKLAEVKLGVLLEAYCKQEERDTNTTYDAWEIMEDFCCNGGIEEILFSCAEPPFLDFYNNLQKEEA